MRIKEFEQKLFLDKGNGGNEFQEIVNLESLGGFRLNNPVEFKIKDSYFDTKDFLLAHNNHYLRLRSKNEKHFITLRLFEFVKDDENVIDEITHPLNDKGIRKVIEKLSDAKFACRSPDYSQIDFSGILRSVGLSSVMAIENTRVEKDIFIEKAENVKVGRIKFDRYAYDSPGHNEFFEIEIDCYERMFLDAVNNFKVALKRIISIPFQETLKSKYRRGMDNQLFVNPLLRYLSGET